LATFLTLASTQLALRRLARGVTSTNTGFAMHDSATRPPEHRSKPGVQLFPSRDFPARGLTGVSSRHSIGSAASPIRDRAGERRRLLKSSAAITSKPEPRAPALQRPQRKKYGIHHHQRHIVISQRFPSLCMTMKSGHRHRPPSVCSISILSELVRQRLARARMPLEVLRQSSSVLHR